MKLIRCQAVLSSTLLICLGLAAVFFPYGGEIMNYYKKIILEQGDHYRYITYQMEKDSPQVYIELQRDDWKGHGEWATIQEYSIEIDHLKKLCKIWK